MLAQKTKQTIPNVEIAKELARRMRQPTAQDRIGLAKEGLAILKQVEPVNGQAKQVERAANRLANALKADYGNPKKGMEAASVATELRSFAMGMRPMIDTLCLS